MACPRHHYKRKYKEKNRAVLLPVLKEHLVEWVDRANEQHVVISEATGKGVGSAFFFIC